MLNKKGLAKFGAGFTLIELMAVIFVVSIGVIASMNLISQIFLYARFNQSKLIASYLAQEGIEVVRNIRDANWVEGVGWNEGVAQGEWEVDYKSQDLTRPFAGVFLNIDADGLYSYSSGSPTKFKRKIAIQEGVDEISVSVQVIWQEFQREYKVEAFERLYNWKP